MGLGQLSYLRGFENNLRLLYLFRRNKALLMAVAKKGFTSPSKIQAQALPMLLSSRRPNMRGQAQHGSGKTATYVLAMLMLCKEEMQCPQAVCICPARELTLQVGEVVKDLGQFTKLKVYISVPGSQERQITEQIVVGTPGWVHCLFSPSCISCPSHLVCCCCPFFYMDQFDRVQDQAQVPEHVQNRHLRRGRG
jgi:ATP-dependent RNA helicase DDX19/DBP5